MRFFTSRWIFAIILLVYLPTASAAESDGSNFTPLDAEKSAKTKILETGAVVLQNQTPDWYRDQHPGNKPKACCIPVNPRGGTLEESIAADLHPLSSGSTPSRNH